MWNIVYARDHYLFIKHNTHFYFDHRGIFKLYLNDIGDLVSRGTETTQTTQTTIACSQ